MRYILSALAVALPTGAFAHAGHIGDLAGHDHWTLGLGLGAIAGAAAVAWVKGRRRKDAAEADAAPEGDAGAEPEAQPA